MINGEAVTFGEKLVTTFVVMSIICWLVTLTSTVLIVVRKWETIVFKFVIERYL